MRTKAKAVKKRPPAPQPPTAPEREYYRLMLKYHAAYREMVEEGLEEMLPRLKAETGGELPSTIHADSVSTQAQELPVSMQAQERFDANAEKTVRELFESVRKRLVKLFPDSLLSRWARSFVNHVNDVTKRNLVRATDAVDVDVEHLLVDGELNPYFQNVIDENVGLIRSIGEDDLPKFKKTLVRAITSDATNADLAAIIADNFKVTKNKAKLLAVDQVGKLNGSLDEYRQQQIGGKRYRWRNMGDERVAGNPSGLYPDAKPSHWDREGKTYYWSNPPAGGHPKHRPRCRCYAEMVMDDVVE